MDTYQKNKNLPEGQQLSTSLYVTLSLLISLAVTAIMAQRYNETQKFMPAGLVAGLSILMSLFYMSKFFAGGKPSAESKKE